MIKASIVGVALSVTLMACGGGGNGSPTPPNPPAAVPTSNLVPSPGPSESPSFGILPLAWMDITEQKDCPAGLCKGLEGFRIEQNGSYHIPAEGQPAIQGDLTPSELEQLAAVADRVAQQDLSGNLTCTPFQPTPGSFDTTVRMHFEDQGIATIYDLDTTNNQLCYRGNINQATALYEVMDSLLQKYAPTPTPSASPSGSPSLSPSASPSVSPSPSPSFSMQAGQVG